LLPYIFTDNCIFFHQIAGSSARDDTSFGIAYPQVKLKEKKILVFLKDFEEGMKKIDVSAAKTEIEKLLYSNVKKSFTNFLQITLVSFQEIQKKVAKVELNSVAHVYIFLRQLEYETRAHTTFMERYKKNIG